DSLGYQDIALIKIDVEGYELNVLRGGLGTIVRSNYPPVIL
ncbi:MAG: FkbM family methyltransferase, partial [Oxalobacteraceae bacterium]|nr:FkbM family methyltransferase [Oxalobacteraceae bacterium]